MRWAKYLVQQAVKACSARQVEPKPSLEPVPQPAAVQTPEIGYVPVMPKLLLTGRFQIEVPPERGKKGEGRPVVACDDILVAMPQMRRLANNRQYGPRLQLRDLTTHKLIAFQAPPGGLAVRERAAQIRQENEELEVFDLDEEVAEAI